MKKLFLAAIILFLFTSGVYAGEGVFPKDHKHLAMQVSTLGWIMQTDTAITDSGVRIVGYLMDTGIWVSTGDLSHISMLHNAAAMLVPVGVHVTVVHSDNTFEWDTLHLSK
ncbi:MAG: hypothetical protein GY841_18010 [FCB group bacterium]|nr:hypothetical protein [FCB group bacterium]